ncbi:carbohydrate-binding domain-containing protein [Eubacterium sp.]|uniref:carbohydrate-binding domain-containing protein n=1 Tax=Eubacterium sp. TaxID=142586 RepID=UPI002FC5F1DF
MIKNKKYSFFWSIALFITMAAILLFFGCAKERAETTNSSIAGDNAYTDWRSGTYTTIALDGSTATVKGEGAAVNGGVVTISSAGTYVVSGSISDGSLVVDSSTDGTVRMVLNGTDITSATTAPIYVKNAGKAIISLEPGTTNTLTDSSTYIHTDAANQEPDATIFSKDDLVFNGTGTLKVTGNAGDAIKGKDDLLIVEGTFDITAADDGITGKDLTQIDGGTFTIKAGGDGIKATNDTDTTKGAVTLNGGTYTITTGADGVQAVTDLTVGGGTYTITTGGGSANALTKTDTQMRPGVSQSTSDTDTSDTGSYKGLKSTGQVMVGGGTFMLDTKDDALHANNTITINGGELTAASGDDGIHADTTLTINDGTINITKSYEGLESADVTIAGGSINVVASDDGINVAGGDGSSTSEERPGAGNFNKTGGSNLLTITGGTTTVNAGGDGLDANGSIAISGGITLVDGPTDNGNGALDYDGTCEVTGGVLITAGSSGMAQFPSDGSTVGTVAMTFSSTQAAGTLVNISDASGKSIVSYTPSKAFSAIGISVPDLATGGSYILSKGGSDAGSATGALVQGGSYSGGTAVVSFTLSSTRTGLNESGPTTITNGMGGGAPGGQGPGQGGPGGR